MRQFIQCASHATAKRRAPWAAVIAKVSGGYIAFVHVADYKTWRKHR